ncbi:regulator of G protein signaling domain-domain-containing protein [Absidia repens]|uniref:Regulator of G protein signaling domain-domain-containing protein n=1 Tax=Absidia repens TaxID=90262 RepID=A0A1X2IP98_9FUNG|nr:regulator of G protein signaling domain-domain-containing protein [Absidia repens]
MAQAYTSVMKFTVDGRPYMKDVHNLFGALITQIKFDSHRYLFRTYDKTFSSEDAIKVLGSLQFSQSIRVPDPKDSSQLVTTVTTTTFNMERGVAKALCQQFLWSRLMFNAVDPNSRSFRDRGLWQLTPKGLVILKDFCKETQADHFLLHEMTTARFGLVTLERSDDDQLMLSRQNMASLFRTVVNGLSVEGNGGSGKEETQSPSSPSRASLSKRSSISSSHSADSGNAPDLSVGSAATSVSWSSSSSGNNNSTSLADRFHLFDNKLIQSATSARQQQQDRQQPATSPSSTKRLRVIFSTQLCCDWLVSFCTIASRDEAETVTTEFLRHGWIDYQNEDDHLDNSTIESSKGTLMMVTVKGRNLVLDTVKTVKTSAAHERRASLASTKSSVSAASLPTSPPATPSSPYVPGALALPPISTIPNASSRPTSATMETPSSPSPTYHSSPPLSSPSSSSSPSSASSSPSSSQQYDGSSARLMIILNDGQLRSLFTDFLRANFCSENLDFWIDYNNLRRKCKNQNPAMPSQNQMDLLEDAYGIWSTYLSPGAKWELNVDQDLQKEMARLVPSMVKIVPTTTYAPTVVNTSSQSNAQCLRSMIKRFDRVETQICRLMSADSVPKFITWLQGYQKKENVPGLEHGIMMLKV